MDKNQKSPRLIVKGSAKLMCLNPDGSIAWKRPWGKNTITNVGFDNYIMHGLINDASALHIGYICLGSGTLPNVTSTQLPNEIQNTAAAVTRQQATSNSFSLSTKLQLYATFGSGSTNFFSAAQTLSNIGLINSSNAGSLFSGMTYAAAPVATNQQVNATYQLTFATTT